MKRFWKYTMSLLVALGTLSCAPDDMDQGLLDSLKPTDPAFVAFSQSLKCVTLPVGALVAAQNLNEYIIAPEENKQAIEDLYYQYEKIRDEGEGKWRIFSSSREELYHILNGLTLDQEGAEWEVVKNETFFLDTTNDPQLPTSGRVILRSLGQDVYEIELTDVTMCVVKHNQTLWRHISSTHDNYYWRYGGVVVDGTFRVTTNNTAFRAGNEELQMEIEGSGEFRDASGAFYGVSMEITDPLKFSYSVEGVPTAYGTGSMSLTVRPSPVEEEQVEVTMSDSRIEVAYRVGGESYLGTHYWNFE